MANVENENVLGFTDRRRTQNQENLPVATPANYATVGALRTRLAAVNPGYWTAARLNAATKNDLVYALRLADDAGGVR